MVTRSQILVRGIVQGVGFRPFVYTEATRLKLRGRVLNSTTGLLIDVEGNQRTIDQFVSGIKLNSPPLSAIDSIECNHNLKPADYADFVIAESSHDSDTSVSISADIATCKDCLAELFDPLDRRYQYPFINCTNCGPRFTIIEDIPYDRARTTMRDFRMCTQCLAEYCNPVDRRFHAEPSACPSCGPQLSLRRVRVTGEVTEDAQASVQQITQENIIELVQDFLRQGEIIAIKGLGGFHLACDALNTDAVQRLRKRKYREDKPFAMMADSVAVVQLHCFVSDAERELLNSRESPIVLLQKRGDSKVAPAVAPGVNNFGFMLPHSPLQHLLLRDMHQPLVMTSGNLSDEPISYDDGEAIQRLSDVADYFLLHDRRIHMRTDDSVVRIRERRTEVLRRSRGYAPAPVRTGFRFERQILACGAELKNTFCLTRENHAYVSHHIGNLENLETLRSYREGIDHFKRLFHLEPEAVAHDLHPEYLSTKYALLLADELVKIGVQHHHAHIASCMADNDIDGEVIGVAMDGLGFGTDGSMWGGEFMVASFEEAERLYHLKYLPMPGGVRAIREPWRMAAMYLHDAFGDQFLDFDLLFVKELESRSWAALKRMAETRTNSPETSSMGRLFDAISAILGIRSLVNYEGQAAIELEAIADISETGFYEFHRAVDVGVIDAAAVVRNVVDDLQNGVATPIVSARFHQGIAHLILSISEIIREERHLDRVALSGGVFQNLFVLRRTCDLLRSHNFHVFTHGRVPTNDGGISLGQAAVANALLKSGRI